jgi:hypothetical protein
MCIMDDFEPMYYSFSGFFLAYVLNVKYEDGTLATAEMKEYPCPLWYDTVNGIYQESQTIVVDGNVQVDPNVR